MTTDYKNQSRKRSKRRQMLMALREQLGDELFADFLIDALPRQCSPWHTTLATDLQFWILRAARVPTRDCSPVPPASEPPIAPLRSHPQRLAPTAKTSHSEALRLQSRAAPPRQGAMAAPAARRATAAGCQGKGQGAVASAPARPGAARAARSQAIRQAASAL